MREFIELLANRATSSLTSGNHRFEFCSSSLRTCGIVFHFEPFSSGSLELFAHVLTIGDGIFEDEFNARTHLLVGKCHTETKFAEVFEE